MRGQDFVAVFRLYVYKPPRIYVEDIRTLENILRGQCSRDARSCLTRALINRYRGQSLALLLSILDHPLARDLKIGRHISSHPISAIRFAYKILKEEDNVYMSSKAQKVLNPVISALYLQDELSRQKTPGRY